MKKTSLKRWSLLGLTLMAVSAVTAAFIPSKAASDSVAVNGTATNEENFTNCTRTATPGKVLTCNTDATLGGTGDTGIGTVGTTRS